MNEQLILLNFNATGHLVSLTDFELRRILEIYENKSILISINFEAADFSQIYWRSERRWQFYQVKVQSKVAEFVKKFLQKELEQEKFGILTSFFPQFNNIARLKLDLFSLGDSRGFNLLFLAAESGNTEAVEYLINNYGFDVNFSKDRKIAADLAYKNEHFETLLVILKFNSKFPREFSKKRLPDEIQKFVNLMEKMHENVKLNNLPQIFEIINQNPKLIHFYNTENSSAPSTAVKYKSFESFQLLINNNVFLGPHEILNDLINNLKISEKIKFDRILENLPDEHILMLLSRCLIIEIDQKCADLCKIEIKSVENSSIDSKVDSKIQEILEINLNLQKYPIDGVLSKNYVKNLNFDKISTPKNQNSTKTLQNLLLKTFNHLNSIPQIQIILKIVAASRSFHLIFIFSTNSIDHLDEPTTNGLFCLNGRIFFAVKNLLDPLRCHEVHGMIAHELCHYVMFLVYGNFAKPYRNFYSEENNFEKIYEACEELSELEELINLVYLNYDNDQQHAELIVRVPHLSAIYFKNIDKFLTIKRIFYPLFDYYDQVCMPEMHRALPEIRRRVEHQIKAENAENVDKNVKLFKDFVNILIIIVIFGILFGFFYEFPVFEWKK